MAKRFRVFAEEEEKSFMMESIKLANALMLLSRGDEAAAGAGGGGAVAEGKVFECKTCSRQFSSFQALGGHRASHKKPRLGGGGAADGPEKARVHECSVCGLEFAIGQALGGHMRRHRASTEGKQAAPATEKVRVLLDLNLPPAEWDEKEEVRKLPKLLGFTLTPAMVDCFH